MNIAVERAINCISERYSVPLSLADSARVFKDATGVAPGQCLSAVRISFTSHFANSVAMADGAEPEPWNQRGLLGLAASQAVGGSAGTPGSARSRCRKLPGARHRAVGPDETL